MCTHPGGSRVKQDEFKGSEHKVIPIAKGYGKLLYKDKKTIRFISGSTQIDFTLKELQQFLKKIEEIK